MCIKNPKFFVPVHLPILRIYPKEIILNQEKKKKSFICKYVHNRIICIIIVQK